MSNAAPRYFHPLTLDATEVLDRFAQLIERAESEPQPEPGKAWSYTSEPPKGGLPKIGRFILSDKCLGHVVDDVNVGVRGAANVLRDCPSAEMRARAANTLEEIAAKFPKFRPKEAAAARQWAQDEGAEKVRQIQAIAGQVVSRESGE